MIQPIAIGEDVTDTGFSPETAESFLSEEEKEGVASLPRSLSRLIDTVLREWKADVASMHSMESAFTLVEREFMVQAQFPDTPKFDKVTVL